LLERIAQGAPLDAVLHELVALVEREVHGMLGSVLLVDNERGTVHPIAGPSLPASYTQALEGEKIGPAAGSCGTAAYLKERVVVADIATHPYWVDYKFLALSHGLRACWSTPILTAEGTVLGTFAMYYGEPREPLPQELAWVDEATDLATIAILRDRSERELRASEQRYRAIASDLDGRIKQLTLLHTIARLIQSELEIDQALLNAIAALVPMGFRSSVQCETRLCYGDIEATTEAFSKVDQRFSQAFQVGSRRGMLEVGYRGGGAPGGDLLAEERELMRSLTDMLVASFGRDQAQRALREAERLEGLGTLAAGIAHDFNNILTAVRGHTELALFEVRDSAVARHSLEEVRAGCLRATKLVRQILTFGQREAMHREPVSLRAVVAEAVGLLASTLPPAIDLRTRFAAGDWPIWADETQVHQVIMNVAGNAIAAMDKRAGEIEIALDGLEVGEMQRHLDLANGRYMRLRIRDEGCGMSQETLTRAFEPFFSTKPASEGTGLGLAVVHGIMKSHDGTVTVDSELGRGTTFELFFPAVGTRPHEPAGATRSPHVLYVDDDEALLVLTLRLLRRLGYRATGVTDPRAALAVLRNDPRAVDVVISDTNMPGFSGPELIREINALHPHVRTVLVSGHIDANGNADAVLKPRSIDELEQLLQRVLRSSLAIADTRKHHGV
jgi:signal transduction histidine kinase/CheY-like chemotaxis protein